MGRECAEAHRPTVHSKTIYRLTCSAVYFRKTENFQATFYTNILRLNLRQNTKFHSIIPDFDKVMPYQARSPGEFLRATAVPAGRPTAENAY